MVSIDSVPKTSKEDYFIIFATRNVQKVIVDHNINHFVFKWILLIKELNPANSSVNLSKFTVFLKNDILPYSLNPTITNISNSETALKKLF